MAKPRFQSVRGMQDVLPGEQERFQHCLRLFTKLAAQAGFERIDTPILEDQGVFSRSVGVDSDLVRKEMYALEDRSGNALALRPEMTAGVVRAYLEHGMASWPQPVKLFYTGPAFRYDRPQEGRLRQFNQLGVEAFGEASPSMDAQVIFLANRYYRELGLKNFTIQINSIGDEACRPGYKKELLKFLESRAGQLCEHHKHSFKDNPLRVLDCKTQDCREVTAMAPQILNHLCADCQQHLTGVLEYLDELNLAYELNPTLVRGLDYYTRTVFEFYGRRQGAQSSLGAGGRYDKLVELLGGGPTPAIGFSLGLERILLEVAEKQFADMAVMPAPVYVASLGEPARLTAFRLVEQLLDDGIASTGAVDKKGIQLQLSRANKLNASYAVIIGQKEVHEGTAMIRDMQSGAQEVVPLSKVAENLRSRLAS